MSAEWLPACSENNITVNVNINITGMDLARENIWTNRLTMKMNAGLILYHCMHGIIIGIAGLSKHEFENHYMIECMSVMVAILMHNCKCTKLLTCFKCPE